jgi:hypothetical protein
MPLIAEAKPCRALALALDADRSPSGQTSGMIVSITDHSNGGGTKPPSAEGAAGALNSAGASGGVSVDSPPPMVDAASALRRARAPKLSLRCRIEVGT